MPLTANIFVARILGEFGTSRSFDVGSLHATELEASLPDGAVGQTR